MKDEKQAPIKPKPSTAKEDDINSRDHHEEDRVSEQLSYSVPMTPLAPTPDLCLSGYVGKSVRLLLRDGNVVIGDMDRPQWDWLRLTDIEEIGKDYRLTAAWGAVRDDTVARIYPGNAKVEKIE